MTAVPSMPIDDIESLKANLNLPDLNYLEITAEADRRAALQDWPLLGEIADAIKRTAA